MPETARQPVPCRTGNELWQEHFPLRVLRDERRRDRPPHRHDFCELAIVCAGTCWHATAGGRCRISVGDVFLIRPGEPHAYLEVRDVSLVNLLYSPSILPLWDLETLPGYRALFQLEPGLRPGGEVRRLRLDRETLGRVEAEIDRLESALDAEAPGSRFRAFTLFLGIVLLLAEYFSSPARLPENSGVAALAGLLDHLERHCDEPIRIPELARRGAMSESTLLRLFRRGTGDTPAGYLARLRIGRARSLLLNTSLPISEIARKTGFGDSNYFSRCFRKHTGVSPRAFRSGGASPDISAFSEMQNTAPTPEFGPEMKRSP